MASTDSRTTAMMPPDAGQYGRIIDWHMEQMAYFLGRVKSLDEGGTSLLDNSMIMFGGSLKDGNAHAVENLPILLAGRGKGTIRPAGGCVLRSTRRSAICICRCCAAWALSKIIRR